MDIKKIIVLALAHGAGSAGFSMAQAQEAGVLFDALQADATRFRSMGDVGAFNTLVQSNANVLDGRVGDFYVDTVTAALPGLIADALRYRGIRLILLERDEAVRNRMLAAFERYTDSVTLLNDDSDESINKLTPEALDTIVDGLLLAIAEARNADG